MKVINLNLEEAVIMQKMNRIQELVKYFKEGIMPIEHSVNYCIYKDNDPIVISPAVLKANYLNKLNVKELQTLFTERTDFKSVEELGLKQQKKTKTDPKLVKENEQLKERIKTLEQELSQYKNVEVESDQDSVFMKIEKVKEPKKKGRKPKKDN